jgi:hypothetical protein
MHMEDTYQGNETFEHCKVVQEDKPLLRCCMFAIAIAELTLLLLADHGTNCPLH